MSAYSRREFLAHSAAGILALDGPGLLAADKPLDMTIAQWKGPQPKDTNDPQIAQIAAKLVQQAIEGLGGMKRFVKKGDVVWVKPNIAWDRKPELAGNTNPDLVAAIVRMCFDAGAKEVKMGDNPVHPAAKTYESSGIPAAVKPLGAKVVLLEQSGFKDTTIGGERVKSLPLFSELIECDVVINVPIVKHHVLADATLCMKNYMGVMENRRQFHQAFPACLADLTRFMKPRLCVLDAVRILKANGPTGGRPDDVVLKTTVAAGVDIVAMDAWGLDMLERKPTQIKMASQILKKAVEVGLGKTDYRSLALKEIAVS